MRPIRPCTRLICVYWRNAHLPRAGDINMYGLSMPRTMIKPKKRKKNPRDTKDETRACGQLADLAEADQHARCCTHSGHGTDHREENPGRLYYCGNRDRHEWIMAETMRPLLHGRGQEKTQTLPKMSVPFVPPKPKEFFTAMSIDISRALLAQ